MHRPIHLWNICDLIMKQKLLFIISSVYSIHSTTSKFVLPNSDNIIFYGNKNKFIYNKSFWEWCQFYT